MTDPELERLMAYVDGELDSEQAETVEGLLARDPEARELVRQFRESRDLLRRGLDQVLDQPVPHKLLKVLEPEAARRQNTSSGSSVVQLRRPSPKPHRPLLRQRYWPSLAAAATLLLGIGVVATVATRAPFQVSSDALVMTSELQRLLDQLPSGQPQSLGNEGSEMMVLATYRIQDERLCREFETYASERLSLGLACREPDRDWTLEFSVDLNEPDQPLTEAPESYMPAAGAEDAISSALDELGAGAALSPAEEAQLIGADWSTEVAAPPSSADQ